MTELGDIFAELGISQYLQDFLDQGFDTWDTILDITESDFDALGVKLGHRRKLQRRIANSRGLSSDRALGSPSRNTPSDDAHEQKQSTGKSEAKEGGTGPHGAKRKYRRHPKPDENAPERPPSAYVIFSNTMREDLKGKTLSFTEIAKLVGVNWQNLTPTEKEPYEQQAFSAKERYSAALGEYKKTNEYKIYSQYLVDFKARQSNQADLDTPKRPKLEAHPSTTSSETASSGASIHGGDTPTGRMRVESSASNTSQWHAPESQASPQLTSLKKLNVVGLTGSQVSPTALSPTVLPGYRDSILNGTHQTLAWREGHRDDNNTPSHQLPSLSTTTNAQRSTYTGAPVADPLNFTGTAQHVRTQAHGPPPPLPSSESTAGRSTGSSGSTNSSIFYSPRTPLEPSFDRALPIPTLYPQKSTGSYDHQHQLPPFQPPSLSPQTSMLGAQSPNGIPVIVDYPGSLRGYGAPTLRQPPSAENRNPRSQEYITASSAEDNLDPINALLKAGEIVNSRTNRNRPPPS